MQYAAQDQNQNQEQDEDKDGDRSVVAKSAHKTSDAANTALQIACAPCILCAVACMCCLVGDQGTFLDGPFCKDCVPDVVHNFAKKVWNRYGKKN